MRSIRAGDLGSVRIEPDRPTLLYQNAEHSVYWVGITHITAFRCNVYLIIDGDQAILVDPGSRAFFTQVRDRVARIVDPKRITALILCHQDPDVAASMVDWLLVNPNLDVYSSPRAHVLLPHYGSADYSACDTEGAPRLALPSGAALVFVPAPFMHFPGAFATFDQASGYLFSGDVWAALDIDWTLVVDDFAAHRARMKLFHMDYMASRVATQGFVRSLADLDINAILPQHGSIIGPQHVSAALDYLAGLECGLDLIYPDRGDGADHAPAPVLAEATAETGGVAPQVAKTAQVSREERRAAGSAEQFMDAEDREFRLRETLAQANRLGDVRDKALHELRLAEQRLALSEARNRLLLQAAGEGILGLDAERHVSFVNAAVLRMTGYEEHELIGRDLRILCREQGSDGGSGVVNQCNMLSPFSDGKMVRVADEMLWRKDGTSFPVEYVAAPSEPSPYPEAVVVVFSDISERLRLEAATRFEASHDTLTRLLNRRRFMELLEQECQRAIRYDIPLSLVMYDADHFKAVNDSHGHLVGDQVLIGIVDAVESELRDLDRHCRWGGEEFLVMATNTSLAGARMLAERMRRRVEQIHLEGVGGVTLSLGVTSFQEPEDMDTLLRRADALLYRAKRNGRNRVEDGLSLDPPG